MYSDAYPCITGNQPPDRHYGTTPEVSHSMSFQGIPETQSPPLSSQPALAGHNIQTISNSQIEQLHTLGGSYIPSLLTPMGSDAPGLFERSAVNTPHHSLIPLEMTVELIHPYQPTPSEEPEQCELEVGRLPTDDPSPLAHNTMPPPPLSLRAKGIRSFYEAMVNALPNPPELPTMQLEGGFDLSHEDVAESTCITHELIQECVDMWLGYSLYTLTSNISACADLNIPCDGIELMDAAHILVTVLDTGIQEGCNVTSVYHALPCRDWFCLVNALIAAITCSII